MRDATVSGAVRCSGRRIAIQLPDKDDEEPWPLRHRIGAWANAVFLALGNTPARGRYRRKESQTNFLGWEFDFLSRAAACTSERNGGLSLEIARVEGVRVLAFDTRNRKVHESSLRRPDRSATILV